MYSIKSNKSTSSNYSKLLFYDITNQGKKLECISCISQNLFTFLLENPAFGAKRQYERWPTFVWIQSNPDILIQWVDIEQNKETVKFDFQKVDTPQYLQMTDLIKQNNWSWKNIVYLSNTNTDRASWEMINLSMAGAIRQVIGMSDQLLRELKQQNPWYNYQNSIESILRNGVTFVAEHEHILIEKRSKNPKKYLPRVYGNYKSKTLCPSLLGLIDQNSLSKVSNTNYYIGSIEKALQDSKLPQVTSQEIANETFEFAPIVIGITPTKKIHLGHLLTMAKAKILSWLNRGKVVVCLNDTWPRVAQAIVCIAKKLDITIYEVFDKLQQNQIWLELIYDCYINRIWNISKSDEKLVEICTKLLQEKQWLFTAIWQAIQYDLSQLGFDDIDIIYDSDFSGDINPQAHSLPWVNIQRYKKWDKNKYGILQNRWVKTALWNITNINNGLLQKYGTKNLVWVDSESLLNQSKELLSLHDTILHIFQWCGISIQWKTLSGSDGNPFTLSYLQQFFKKHNLAPKEIPLFLGYFITTTPYIQCDDGYKNYEFDTLESVETNIVQKLQAFREFIQIAQYIKKTIDDSVIKITVNSATHSDNNPLPDYTIQKAKSLLQTNSSQLGKLIQHPLSKKQGTCSVKHFSFLMEIVIYVQNGGVITKEIQDCYNACLQKSWFSLLIQ